MSDRPSSFSSAWRARGAARRGSVHHGSGRHVRGVRSTCSRDPDHLAAIAPLASDPPAASTGSPGALWGFGHLERRARRRPARAAVQGLAAGRRAVVVERMRRSASRWSRSALWGLERALRTRVGRRTPHQHGGVTHAHAHVHAPPHTHAGVRRRHPARLRGQFALPRRASARSRCPISRRRSAISRGYGVGTVAAMSVFSHPRSASSRRARIAAVRAPRAGCCQAAPSPR